MKLLLSFVTLSVLGSASLVKFFEVPGDMLLGEPIYILRVSQPDEMPLSPPADSIATVPTAPTVAASDTTVVIPGMAVGGISEPTPVTTDISSFGRQDAPQKAVAPVSVPTVETRVVKASNNSSQSPNSDLSALAASTAQPDSVAKQEPRQELAALPSAPGGAATPQPAVVKAGTQLVAPLGVGPGPIANITLPVRAPRYYAARNDGQAVPGNGSSNTVGPQNGLPLDTAAREAERVRRQAVRNAASARRKAQQRAALLKAQQAKPKIKPTPIVKAAPSWQSDILGSDD